MLPKLLNQISLKEWFAIENDVVRVYKSKLVVFNIDDSIFKLITYMS